jgi:hypothetical protein
MQIRFQFADASVAVFCWTLAFASAAEWVAFDPAEVANPAA